MINNYLKYFWMFVFLVIIQILILNQVQFSGYINPYFYLLFILLLPATAQPWLVLLSSFLIGIVIDAFSNTMGIHAAASVFAGYIRPAVIRVISTRDEEYNEYPGLQQNKFSWFLLYTSVIVLSHHLILFYLEVFSFNHFFITLLRVLLSSVFTIFIIVLSQFIIFRK
ncbi:MAG: rod shape-determining protein MreD [Prolixibacteraceae bacterium]|nr:rod shape-determining protein MreD [Prolixibacteraceae bacterium]